MNLILTLFLNLIVFQALSAEDKAPVAKSWKTFQSDYGYEFKYPDCWELRIDDPDEEGAFTQIKNLMVFMGDKCTDVEKKLKTTVGIDFTTDLEPLKSKQEAMKDINLTEKWSRSLLATKEHLVTKRYSLDGNEVIFFVESLSSGDVRWRMNLYCPTRKITIFAPSIKKIDKSYLDKFKLGDFAMPEPEKTIYESVKCIEVKKKIKNKLTK